MPVLGGLLLSAFGGLVTFLATFLTRKLAIAAAAIAAFGLAIGALLAVWNNTMSGLVGQLFSSQYGQFLGLFFPPVAGNCLAVYSTLWAACTLYKWQKTAIQLSATA